MSKLTAIIPARAGSKRLPGKNTIDFNGKPMIEWTLIAAKEAKLFSRIIVSTDDDRVRTIASDYDVTIVPQPQYTQDNMASRKVVSHALSRFHGVSDFAVLLQPTSPLRTAEHIKAAWKVLNKTRFYSLVSVNPMGEVNGAIYIFTGECGRFGDVFYDDHSLRFVMDEKSSVDIDTMEDLRRAESFMVDLCLLK